MIQTDARIARLEEGPVDIFVSMELHALYTLITLCVPKAKAIKMGTGHDNK